MKYGFKLTMKLKLKLLWYEEIIGKGINLQQGNYFIVTVVCFCIGVSLHNSSMVDLKVAGEEEEEEVQDGVVTIMVVHRQDQDSNNLNLNSLVIPIKVSIGGWGEDDGVSGVLDTTLCYIKFCQWLATGRWFSPVLRFPLPIKLTATILLKYCWKWS